MREKYSIVFVSLAENQSNFFSEIGRNLHRKGFEIYHICFHEGAAKKLAQAGFNVFNPYQYQSKNSANVSFHDYGISNASLLIGHEKAAYELSDTEYLVQKLKNHLSSMETIIKIILEKNRNLIFIQELGGFTSTLSAFYVAQKFGIDNYFIEPSFFRGRVFFSKNTFSAPAIYKKTNNKVSNKVQSYLDEIISSKALVIPSKDQNHFRGVEKKLVDISNYRRLIEKIFYKYILRQQEEFNYIGGHVFRHIKMFKNSRKLKSLYANMLPKRKIIYYPFHVPADFALTLRSPEYLDQYSTIDYLCRSAPLGWKVVIKEHPALEGAVDPMRISKLLKQHDNLIIVPPTTNNHLILEKTDTVLTINSKAGAEALLYRKRVLVLGDAFYSKSSLVKQIQTLSKLPLIFEQTFQKPSQVKVNQFFQNVWESSYSGELFNLDTTNILEFSKSVYSVLKKNYA